MKNLWAIKWRGWQAFTEFNMSGTDDVIVYSLAKIPLLFPTRKLAKKYIDDFYSLVCKERKFKKPMAVKVRIEEVG